MTDLLAALDTATLSENTRTNYRTYVSTLSKHFDIDLLTVLKQADKSISWIMKSYGSGDASKKNMIAAVLAIFKHNKNLEKDLSKPHEKWQDAYKKLSERLDDRYKTNKPSDKQNDGYVPFADIETKRESLPKGSPDRLLLAMYTLIRPLRGDFNKIRIYTGRMPAKTDENYIHLTAKDKDSELVLTEYKTAKKNGEYRRNLPATLVAEIKASLAKRPRDYLFVKTDGEPFELANS